MQTWAELTTLELKAAASQKEAKEPRLLSSGS